MKKDIIKEDLKKNDELDWQIFNSKGSNPNIEPNKKRI